MFLFVAGSINLEETSVIMTDNHPHDHCQTNTHKSILQVWRPKTEQKDSEYRVFANSRPKTRLRKGRLRARHRVRI